MSHPTRETVFKWAFDNFAQVKKRWIEFDYSTGEELEPGGDIEDDYDDECEGYDGECYCEDCLWEAEHQDWEDEEVEDDDLSENADVPELIMDE
jgi:hypothetical protein